VAPLSSRAKPPQVRLMQAKLSDAQEIAGLLRPYAVKGLVLPRTAAEIEQHIGLFLVAVLNGNVAGCVALRDYGAGLVEIRSLAVSRDSAGVGLGSKLVAAAVKRATAKNEATRIFALTLRPNLFQRLGFNIVADKEEHFPQKIWNDCRHCRKQERCDETAVLFRPRPPGTKKNPGAG